MSDLKYEDLYFIGKTFQSKGTRKDKENNTIEWTRYQLQFKRKLDDQYPVKIYSFSGLKGEEKLIEGNLVKVGYELSAPTFNEKAQKEIQYKNAKFIGEPTDPSDIPEPQKKLEPATPKTTEEQNILDPEKPINEEEEALVDLFTDYLLDNQDLDKKTARELFIGQWVCAFTTSVSARAGRIFDEKIDTKG